MNYDALKLENQLCFPLYAAARKITSQYTPYLKPLGITYTQYLVFMVLWEEDRLLVGDLCKRLMLDSGTITPLLKKMEKQGYVTRERCLEDERCVTVSLTDEGRALREKAVDIPMNVSACVKLPPEDAKELYRILYELLENY